MAPQHALLSHSQLLQDPERTSISRIAPTGYLRKVFSLEPHSMTEAAASVASPFPQ